MPHDRGDSIVSQVSEAASFTEGQPANDSILCLGRLTLKFSMRFWTASNFAISLQLGTRTRFSICPSGRLILQVLDRALNLLTAFEAAASAVRKH